LRDKERPYLDQIISGGVDIDKMDYIVRDSFHTGAGYGSIDVHRLLYTMDIIDGSLSVDGTALATLESFLLARFESFRTIYFHRASRAVQIMIVRALEAARDELHLLDFARPEDYLKLDDYKVWTELKECKKSKKIMNDLEARRLLKCAYESTLFSSEAPVSNVFSSEHVRADIEKQIARKARIPEENVIIDVPTLQSVPYQQTADMQPMDIAVFKRVPQGKKQIVPLAEVSRIVGVLQTFMRLVRVYTEESYRSRVELAAHQILEDAQSSGKILR
jgi:HD superfamily phosphohydrolase